MSASYSPNFFKAYLATALLAGTASSTVVLDRVTTLTGETLETADLALMTKGVLTVNPEGDGLTSYPENISFTTVTSATKTLSGCVRGIDKSNTTQTSLMHYHAVGTPVIISFGTHQVADFFTYVAGIVAGTVGTASTTVAGTTKLSVAPASAPNPIAVGTNDNRVLVGYAVDSVGTDSYAITPSPAITAYSTGQVFTFKAGTANTGAATLAVSGLSAIAIVKDASVALETGDIVANQIVVVEYDGTSMIMVNHRSSPTGTITMYAGATAPSGWLLCDASAVSRATYAALFALIGTTYGAGDTTTTFNVPDMRGRVPIGVGTGIGGGAAGTGLPTGGTALTAVARAGWKGEETHALIEAENGPHTHTLTAPRSSAGGSAATFSEMTTNSTALTTSSSGSGTAHNTIQPVLGVQFCIKT